MIYQNFDLEIICPQEGGELCARVLDSPQGDCPFIGVKWPFEAEEESELLSEIYGGLRQRRAASSRGDLVQDFGGRLFEAVFSGDIEHLFRASLDTAFRSGKGLRIRLRLPEDSELHTRPWEFLFDTESREFLAVREHTPLVRYLPVAQPIPPIAVEGPLRILVALSSPTDHPRLDIAREWEILCHALEPSISAGQLELRRVPGRCTFDNLRDSLRHFGTHIFHFVGHGLPGALVLEQESGKGLEMEATHLRSAFPSGSLPRLIVLNACSGAIAEDVPFSGLAQGFLKQGVPAVVAMQASITDDAALIFTRYFYRDLVETGAVDTALTEARLRMQGNGHPIEWGTPVLYMRALSGQLFQPPAEATEPKRHRETQTRPDVTTPRTEPSLSERKKTREVQPKANAPPPQAAGSPTEKRKPRTARTRESAPPPKLESKLEPKLDGQSVPPNVQARENAPAPGPKPGLAGQNPVPLPEPGPGLARPDIPPTFPVKEQAPPPEPKVHVDKPQVAPKNQAGKHTAPPPRLEPRLDELDSPADAQAREAAPTVKLEPAPNRKPPPAPRTRKIPGFLVYGLAGGLLAGVLAFVVGLDKILLPRKGEPPVASVPAPAPAPAPAPTTATTTMAPAAAPAPMTVQTPPTPNDASPPTRAEAGGQSKRDAEARPGAPGTKPKPPATASRKTRPAPKAAHPRAVDDCRNPDVSERSVNCIFGKQ